MIPKVDFSKIKFSGTGLVIPPQIASLVDPLTQAYESLSEEDKKLLKAQVTIWLGQR